MAVGSRGSLLARLLEPGGEQPQGLVGLGEITSRQPGRVFDWSRFGHPPAEYPGRESVPGSMPAPRYIEHFPRGVTSSCPRLSVQVGFTRLGTSCGTRQARATAASTCRMTTRAWMAGTSPAMTHVRRWLCGLLCRLAPALPLPPCGRNPWDCRCFVVAVGPAAPHIATVRVGTSARDDEGCTPAGRDRRCVTPTRYWGYRRLRAARRSRVPSGGRPRSCTRTPTSTTPRRPRVLPSSTPPTRSSARRTSARPSTAARSMPRASRASRASRVSVRGPAGGFGREGTFETFSWGPGGFQRGGERAGGGPAASRTSSRRHSAAGAVRAAGAAAFDSRTKTAAASAGRTYRHRSPSLCRKRPRA